MSESGDRNPKSVFELAGAVAVLLGLIFVGLELRQNTAAVQAATFQDLIHASSDFLVDIGSDPATQRIYVNGMRHDSLLLGIFSISARKAILMKKRVRQETFTRAGPHSGPSAIEPMHWIEREKYNQKMMMVLSR